MERRHSYALLKDGVQSQNVKQHLRSYRFHSSNEANCLRVGGAEAWDCKGDCRRPILDSSSEESGGSEVLKWHKYAVASSDRLREESGRGGAK